jgi:hypothetical protein
LFLILIFWRESTLGIEWNGMHLVFGNEEQISGHIYIRIQPYPHETRAPILTLKLSKHEMCITPYLLNQSNHFAVKEENETTCLIT